jgi:hypothetical protein
MCQKKHPRLVSLLLPPYPVSPEHIPVFWNTILQRVLSSVGGVTLRMEAGGRKPSLEDIQWPGDLANLLQLRGSTNYWIR